MIVKFTDPDGEPVYINTATMTMMRKEYVKYREINATCVWLGNVDHFVLVTESAEEITKAVNQMNELFKG